jgi:Cu/Ag efflux pump CusA
VQVIVDAPGPPTLLERWVTIPVERGLASASGLRQIRSTTATGRVVVTLDLATPNARQEVIARLRDVMLPAGMTARVGPPTSPDGALVHYALHGDRASSVDLRTLQDSTIRPALLRVFGVADVSSCGGAVEQIDVTIDPTKLGKVTIEDVATAIGKDAGRLAHQRTIDDVANEMVKAIDSTPIRVDDVATVARGRAPRQCVVMDERSSDAVTGTAWLRVGVGADRERVRRGVIAALDLLRAELPPGVTLEVVPDAARATVILPPASFDDQRRLLERLRGAGTTLELGAEDGGYLTAGPDTVRVRLAEAQAGTALADRVRTIPDAAWTGEGGTAWIRIAGPDLDELARLASRLTAKLDVIDRAGTQRLRSIEVSPDRARLLAANISAASLDDAVRAGLDGLPAGTLFDRDRELAIIVHVPAALTELPIGEIKLGALAQVRTVVEPRVILRERMRRQVRVRVRVRDLAALRAQLRGEQLPPGYEAAVE